MLKIFELIGRYFILMGKVFSRPEKAAIYRRRIVYEMESLGIDSIGLTAIISVCLLYTSDAADERSSVDLCGRRLPKKKKKKQASVIRQYVTHTNRSKQQRSHKSSQHKKTYNRRY